MSTDPEKVFHMTPDEFRRWGKELVDWIADYRERVADHPVLSQAEPGSVRAKLPAAAPETGDGFVHLLEDLDEIVLPGVTHWQSPDFFAFFPSNASLVSVLGDLVSTGLGVQGMLWATSPACTEVETHVLDWLVPALGLPEAFLSTSDGGGVIQDSASSATLCALLAARERATGFAATQEGVPGNLAVYASTQAHSSVEKAVRIAGLGAGHLRLIETDEGLSMRPDALAAAMEKDRRVGLIPAFVCATIGTTSSLAVDPVAEIGRVAAEHGAWLHVDAAMAGTAAICPENRWLHDGLEAVDSYCFNPHKWMFTAFDCDCFWVRDRSVLVHALSVLPEYLRNTATESGKVIDYRDWQVSLGRRFRSLKLWFVLRWYGIEGIRHHVRRHIELAERFAGWVEEDERFELAVPRSLNLVCFRMKGSDEDNERLLAELNASGALYLSHTRLFDRHVLRMSIGQTWTEEHHVAAAWERIRGVAEKFWNRR